MKRLAVCFLIIILDALNIIYRAFAITFVWGLYCGLFEFNPLSFWQAIGIMFFVSLFQPSLSSSPYLARKELELEEWYRISHKFVAPTVTTTFAITASWLFSLFI